MLSLPPSSRATALRSRMVTPTPFGLASAGRQMGPERSPLVLPALTAAEANLSASLARHLSDHNRTQTAWIAERTQGHAEVAHGHIEPAEASIILRTMRAMGRSWLPSDSVRNEATCAQCDDVAVPVAREVTLRRVGIVDAAGRYQISAWRAALWQRQPDLAEPDPFLVARVAESLDAWSRHIQMIPVQVTAASVQRHAVRLTGMTTSGRIGAFLANLAG